MTVCFQLYFFLTSISTVSMLKNDSPYLGIRHNAATSSNRSSYCLFLKAFNTPPTKQILSKQSFCSILKKKIFFVCFNVYTLITHEQYIKHNFKMSPVHHISQATKWVSCTTEKNTTKRIATHSVFLRSAVHVDALVGISGWKLVNYFEKTVSIGIYPYLRSLHDHYRWDKWDTAPSTAWFLHQRGSFSNILLIH